MPECTPCKHEQQIHDLERKVNSLEIANAKIETVRDIYMGKIQKWSEIK